MKPKGQTPDQVASHSAILLHQYLLVFGGTSFPFGRANGNTLNIYNIRDNCWKILCTVGCLPPKLYGQALALQNNLIYTVGGTSGIRYFMDVHILNLKTKQWKQISTKDHPLGRYRHEIVLYNNKIYVFGGGTDRETYALDQIPVLNLENQKWEVISTTGDKEAPFDLPHERKFHGCIQIGKDVYLFGGFNEIEILSDIWKINLETRQWTRYKYDLPQPVYFHSVAINPNGQIFIFGGVTCIMNRTRTNEMYTLWLSIPTLKEICWLAILHYVPHLSKLPIEQLLSIGIPNTFIKRLNKK